MKAKGKKLFEKKLEKTQLLESYSIERTVESVARQFGTSPTEIVKLNYNENFYMPRERLVELMKEVADECDLRIYPQEEEYRLKEKLGEYLNIPETSIIVGDGSDELIARIAQLFLEEGDQALSITPTFSFYKYCICRLGAKHLEVPLRKDFALDMEQILAAVTPETALLYLVCPNNPTANQFNREKIKAIIEEFPGIVIVDEAYAEYADYSLAPLLNDFKNLIILRTFSKAFGLAGLRLGYGACSSELAKALSEKALLPYSVGSIALRMGLKLLENRSIVEKAVEQLKAERETLIKKLNEIDGVKAFTSKTNFVLFQTEKQYEEVYQSLLSQGILVKKLGKVLHLNNCLRTTVGLPWMNAKLLQTLEEICG